MEKSIAHRLTATKAASALDLTSFVASQDGFKKTYAEADSVLLVKRSFSAIYRVSGNQPLVLAALLFRTKGPVGKIRVKSCHIDYF